MDADGSKQIELSQDKSINEISSNVEKYSNDILPDKIVESVGYELKDTLIDWSNVLRQCKKIEDDTLAQLDNMLKQAYLLEAEYLKQRLDTVNKIIDKK